MTVPSSYAPASRQTGRPKTGPRARRLAWASVPVWPLGFLAFVPFLRVAFDRRRARDWRTSAAYVAVVAGVVALVSVGGTAGAVSAASGGVILLLIGCATVHGYVAFGPAADPLLPW